MKVLKILIVTAVFFSLMIQFQKQISAESAELFTDPTNGKGYFSIRYPTYPDPDSDCNLQGYSEDDIFQSRDSRYIYIVDTYIGVCKFDVESGEVIAFRPNWGTQVNHAYLSSTGEEMFVQYGQRTSANLYRYARFNLDDGSRGDDFEIQFFGAVGSFAPNTILVWNSSQGEYQNIDIHTGEAVQSFSDNDYVFALGTEYSEAVLFFKDDAVDIYEGGNTQLNFVESVQYSLPEYSEAIESTRTNLVVMFFDSITDGYEIEWIDLSSGEIIDRFDIPAGWTHQDIEVSDDGKQTFLLFSESSESKVAVINNDNPEEYYVYSTPAARFIKDLPSDMFFLAEFNDTYRMIPVIEQVFLPSALRDYCAGPFHDDFTDTKRWPSFNTSYATGAYINESYSLSYTPSSGSGLLSLRSPYEVVANEFVQLSGQKTSGEGAWGFYVDAGASAWVFLYFPHNSNWQTLTIVDGEIFVAQSGVVPYDKPLSGYEALNMITFPEQSGGNQISEITFGIHDYYHVSTIEIPPTDSIEFHLAVLATDGTVNTRFDDFYIKSENCSLPPLPE